jgi:hypothetical protein
MLISGVLSGREELKDPVAGPPVASLRNIGLRHSKRFQNLRQVKQFYFLIHLRKIINLLSRHSNDYKLESNG